MQKDRSEMKNWFICWKEPNSVNLGVLSFTREKVKFENEKFLSKWKSFRIHNGLTVRCMHCGRFIVFLFFFKFKSFLKKTHSSSDFLSKNDYSWNFFKQLSSIFKYLFLLNIGALSCLVCPFLLFNFFKFSWEMSVIVHFGQLSKDLTQLIIKC